MATVRDAGVHGNIYIFPAFFLDFASLLLFHVFGMINYAVDLVAQLLQTKEKVLYLVF